MRTFTLTSTITLSEEDIEVLKRLVNEGWNDRLPEDIIESWNEKTAVGGTLMSLEAEGLIEDHHEGSAFKLTWKGEQVYNQLEKDNVG